MGEVTRFIVHSWSSPYGIKIARGGVMKQRRRTGEGRGRRGEVTRIEFLPSARHRAKRVYLVLPIAR